MTETTPPAPPESAPEDEETVILAMPAWVRDLLQDTLELDSRSSAFERELRAELTSALGEVVDVTEAVVDMITAYEADGFGCVEEVVALCDRIGYEYHANSEV